MFSNLTDEGDGHLAHGMRVADISLDHLLERLLRALTNTPFFYEIQKFNLIFYQNFTVMSSLCSQFRGNIISTSHQGQVCLEILDPCSGIPIRKYILSNYFSCGKIVLRKIACTIMQC